ncbi:hypothetical protein [Oceanidesulfovibrio marinus]|uniref:Uncharacterized protein n=1 Tax=Oceanidesulfovibrio marinus TaxID=370038 RepID=A0A6P1ZD63_9BACT|nr:hypothetical protein [Oceanidesulfovibrio marinus]TVM32128.1 hypothetical protein DQK91_16495 [Oceanidesulfovibrio marinus]
MPSPGHDLQTAERVAIELAAQAEVFLESFAPERFCGWAERVFLGLPRSEPDTPRPVLAMLVPLRPDNSFLKPCNQARAVRELLQHYQLETRDRAGVSFAWRDTHVLVGVDLDADCILRLALHGYPPCSGLVEVWPGHAHHRLNAAANGGSFAQIPGGRTSAIEIDISRPSDSYGGPDDEIIA